MSKHSFLKHFARRDRAKTRKSERQLTREEEQAIRATHFELVRQQIAADIEERLERAKVIFAFSWILANFTLALHAIRAVFKI